MADAPLPDDPAPPGPSAPGAEASAAPRRSRAPRSPLVQRVYQRLLAQITAGDYRQNQRLPGEHELAAQFAVSRPVVREALGFLREEGLVYSRQGAGSFVSTRGKESGGLSYAPVETIADIQRCYDFRLTIEPDCAFYAAQRRNETALHAISTALGLLRNATESHYHRSDADFAFHVAIAEASNNHYYVSSLLALKNQIGVVMKFHGASLLSPSLRLDGVFQEHHAIIRRFAIARRKPRAV
jgi:DNA-binding FadR family transcriptional regulator